MPVCQIVRKHDTQHLTSDINSVTICHLLGSGWARIDLWKPYYLVPPLELSASAYHQEDRKIKTHRGSPVRVRLEDLHQHQSQEVHHRNYILDITGLYPKAQSHILDERDFKPLPYLQTAHRSPLYTCRLHGTCGSLYHVPIQQQPVGTTPPSLCDKPAGVAV
jgi:hypothetical protein